MAELRLSDEQINKALEAAVLVALGEVERKRIIKGAIDHLTRLKSTYPEQPPPLMEVILWVAQNIAETIRENLVQRLADKMAEGLEKDRY